MKSKMFKKLMAASLATVMSVGLLACGGEKATEATATPAPQGGTDTQTPSDGGDSGDVSDDPLANVTVLNDPATGKPYDLGGMEIIIRDWWSGDGATLGTSEYALARQDYLDFIQTTYNFTIKQVGISSWGDVPGDFADYVQSGGDETNYVFVLRNGAECVSAMKAGFMYDLSSLDCLDFSEAKFANGVHNLYTMDGKYYCMVGGYSEPRMGMYFNKRLLREAGIDPESIYDMQKEGTWTWDAWVDIMSKVQKDVDSDGVIDIWGWDGNIGDAAGYSWFANGSEIVGYENGQFTFKFDDPKTLEGIDRFVEICNEYAHVRPAEDPNGTNWELYKEYFKNGECVFMPEHAYVGSAGNWGLEMTDAQNGDVGFVMFPKGPSATDYITVYEDNPMAIPSCYDADRAWKIAFAYNLYTNDVPGYEGMPDLTNYRNGIFDIRALEETFPLMYSKGYVNYSALIAGFGNNFLAENFVWKINKGCAPASELVDSVRVAFTECIDEANAN